MDKVEIDKKYLKITKLFAKLSGIWPGQRNYIKYTSWSISFILTTTILFFQMARVIHYHTSDVLIEHSTLMTPGVLLLLKQGNYILNSTKLRSLLRCVYSDWSVNRPREEFEIMSMYAERGALFAMFYLVNAYICAFLFMQVPWTVLLLTKLELMNSTTVFYVIPAYYFADEYKYYYWINAHASAFVILVVVVYVAADTGYMILVQHACGLLAVAGYRFKNAIHDDLSSGDRNSKRVWMEAYRRVCLSIKAHEHAIAYLREIESAHMIYLFLCMGLNVLCFSITLVKVVSMEPCVDTYKYISFLTAQLMHLFYLTIQGQFIIDMTDELYNTIYEALWYKSNPKTQVLYVLVLRRSLTPPRLTAGGLLQLNMQTFSEMARVICFFSLDALVQQCSFLGGGIEVLVKQGNYIINAAQYTSLIDSIRNDWLMKRSIEEIHVMHTCAKRGALFTNFCLTCCTFSFLLFLQIPLTSQVLDIVLPRNESTSLTYICPAYYALDEEKYHVLIVTHMISGILLVLFVFVSCDTSFTYVVQHTCGLLAVSGHRFKVAIEEISTMEKSSRRDEIYISVCRSIRGYRHALKYLQNIQQSHDTYLFIYVGMVMICFSVTLAKVSSMDEFCIELAKDCTFVLIQLVHIFCLALQGQFVIDSHEKLLKTIYDSLWHNRDKRTQLLYVLALRSCFAPPRLTAGGLITLYLQSFAEIIKASVSYFTVRKST